MTVASGRGHQHHERHHGVLRPLYFWKKMKNGSPLLSKARPTLSLLSDAAGDFAANVTIKSPYRPRAQVKSIGQIRTCDKSCWALTPTRVVSVTAVAAAATAAGAG